MVICGETPSDEKTHETMRPLAFPDAAGFIDSSHVLAAPAGAAAVIKSPLAAIKAAISPTKYLRRRIRGAPLWVQIEAGERRLSLTF
jgi:hypothetical protein